MELDSTQSVPQPTLSQELDDSTCEVLLICHSQHASPR